MLRSESHAMGEGGGGGEYSVLALLAVVFAVTFELRFARTGLFRSRAYWISMGIVFCFQVLVDGWLTKLSAPIVLYASDEISGLRFPWDIPVEDYLFGFALTTLAIANWIRCSK